MLRPLALGALLFALAVPAAATAPGNRGPRILDFVPHYKVSDPNVACTETDPAGAFDPEFGFDLSLCQPRWTSPPIRGVITFIAQERAAMVCSDSPPTSPTFCGEVRPIGDPAGPGYTASECGASASCVHRINPDDPAATLLSFLVTVLIEFDIEGQHYALAQTYTQQPNNLWPANPFGLNFLQIGGWNPDVLDESPVQSGEFENMIPVGNQRDLQVKLREIAIAAFGQDGIPLMQKEKGKGIVADENGDSAANPKPLASVYRLRIQLRFAEADTDGDVPEF